MPLADEEIEAYAEELCRALREARSVPPLSEREGLGSATVRFE